MVNLEKFVTFDKCWDMFSLKEHEHCLKGRTVSPAIAGVNQREMYLQRVP